MLSGIAGVFVLAGCDGKFESRQSVALGSADAASKQIRARVVDAVRNYAATEGIRCQSQPGYLVYCFDQPIYLAVRERNARVEVCYSARGAQFESSKFQERIQRLAAQVDAAAGAPVPQEPLCSVP